MLQSKIFFDRNTFKVFVTRCNKSIYKYTYVASSTPIILLILRIQTNPST